MEITGRALAEKVKRKIKKGLLLLSSKGISPKIAIITLGNEASWKSFVKQKENLAKSLGIKKELILVKNESEKALLALVQKLNQDKNVNGIIVQRPLSKKIDRAKVISAISKYKDIDGFRKDSKFKSPIWLAVKTILKRIHQLAGSKNKTFSKWLREKSIIVIGKGETGGAPIIDQFKKIGLQIKIIDSKTPYPEKITGQADIIICAVGKKDVIKVNAIKKGVILLGIGTHAEKDKLKGDYNEQEIKDRAEFYTPMPGGIGPLNIAFLFDNLVEAAKLQAENKNEKS